MATDARSAGQRALNAARGNMSPEQLASFEQQYKPRFGPTQPIQPTARQFAQLKLTQPIDRSLPQGTQEQLQQTRSLGLRELREMPENQGLGQKLSALWNRGDMLFQLDRAVAKAKDIEGPEGDAAVDSLLSMRDAYNFARYENPLDPKATGIKGVFEKMAYGAASSGAPMADLIFRELIIDAGIAVGSAALTGLTGGAAAPAAVAGTAKLAGTAARIGKVMKGIQSTARAASKFGYVRKLGQADDIRKMWGAVGLTGNLLEASAKATPTMARIGRAAAATYPMMQQGEGQIYANLYEQGVDKQTARTASKVGGFMYGLIEGVVSPLDVASAAGGGTITQGAKKMLMRNMNSGMKRGVVNAVAKLGSNAVGEWAEEGAQSLVTGFSELTARQLDRSRLIEGEIVDAVEQEMRKNAAQNGGEVVEQAWDDMKESIWGVLGLTLPLGAAGVYTDIRSSKAVSAIEQELLDADVDIGEIVERRNAIGDDGEYKPQIQVRRDAAFSAMEIGGTREDAQAIMDAPDQEQADAILTQLAANAKAQEEATAAQDVEDQQKIATDRAASYATDLDEVMKTPKEALQGALDAENPDLASVAELHGKDPTAVLQDATEGLTVEDVHDVFQTVSDNITDEIIDVTDLAAVGIANRINKVQKVVEGQLTTAIGEEQAKATAKVYGDMLKAEVTRLSKAEKVSTVIADKVTEGGVESLTEGETNKYEANKELVDQKVKATAETATQKAEDEALKTATVAEKQAAKVKRDEASALKRTEAKAQAVAATKAKTEARAKKKADAEAAATKVTETKARSIKAKTEAVKKMTYEDIASIKSVTELNEAARLVGATVSRSPATTVANIAEAVEAKQELTAKTKKKVESLAKKAENGTVGEIMEKLGINVPASVVRDIVAGVEGITAPEGRATRNTAFTTPVVEEVAKTTAEPKKTVKAKTKAKVKTQAAPTTAQQTKLVTDIGKELNVNVKFSDDKFSSWDAASNTITVSKADPTPMLTVFGHEFGHKMFAEKPKMANELLAWMQKERPLVLQNAIDKYSALQEKAGTTASNLTEEGAVEVIGEVMADPTFWQTAKAEMPPGLFNRVLAFARSLFNAVVKANPKNEELFARVKALIFSEFDAPSVPTNGAQQIPQQQEMKLRPVATKEETDAVEEYSSDTATKIARLASRPTVPSLDAMHVIGGLLEGEHKQTQHQGPLSSLADSVLPAFANLPTKLNQIGRAAVNVFNTEKNDVGNRDAQVRNNTMAFTQTKESKKVIAAARLDEKAAMKDGAGEEVKGMQRRHIASFYGYVKQGELDQMLRAYNAGGNAAVEAKIQQLAFEQGDTPKDVKRIARQYTAQAYTFMGAKPITTTEKGKTVNTMAKDANGNIAYDTKRETLWVLKNPAEGLVGKFKGTASSVVMTPQSMVDAAASADKQIVDFYEKVYRPLSDEVYLPAIMEEWRRSHPKRDPLTRIENHLPMLRLYAKDTAKTERLLKITEDEGGEGSQYGGMEQQNSVLDIVLDNFRGVQERGTSQSDMYLYGLDELAAKQMDEAGRYQANSLSMNWATALKENEGALRATFGQKWLDDIKKDVADLSGTIDINRTVIDAFATKAMSRFGKIALQSPWVIMFQPASALSFITQMGTGNVAKAIKSVKSAQGKTHIEGILKHAPQLQMRRSFSRVETQYEDTSMLSAMFHSMSGVYGKKVSQKIGKASDFMMKGITWGDTQAINVGILSAYNQVKAENPELSDAEIYPLAAQFSQIATNMTQVSSDAAYMSTIRRNGSFLSRIVTFMSGATSAAWNVGMQAATEVRRDYEAMKETGSPEAKERFQKSLYRMRTVGMSLAAQAAIIAAIKTGRDVLTDAGNDEEEDKKRAKNVRRLGLNLADSAIGYIPASSLYSPWVMSQVAGAIGDDKAKAKYGFRAGRTAATAALGPMKDLGRAQAQWTRVRNGDVTGRQAEVLAQQATRNMYKGLLGWGSYVTGVNASAVAREINRGSKFAIDKPLIPQLDQQFKKGKK